MSFPAYTRSIALALLGLPAVAMCQGVSSRALDDEAIAAGLEPPRLERSDIPNITPRSLPGYRTDLTEISLQRWATRGRAGVGVGIGSIALVDRPNGLLTGLAHDAGAVPTASATTLMLGLRYQASDRSSFYADATHVRGLGLASDEQVVGKVGMEFKAAQSDWKIAYGGLGFRFGGDTRMTLKLRRSGINIVMRRAF